MDAPRRAAFGLLVLLICSISIQAAFSQCIDTSAEADLQAGCPDPFYSEISKPLVSRNLIQFNITIKNMRIIFPPNCNLGEESCYENLNSQGLALCRAEGWSGAFQDVKVALASCFPDCDLQGCPDCDFNVTVSPSGRQKIENGKSQDYRVSVRAYDAMGNYEMSFQASESSAKKKVFSIRVNISDQAQGFEGDNEACPACRSMACERYEGDCISGCSGASFCSAPDCLFDTASSGAAESCCGDDSGEILRHCSASDGLGWVCSGQPACCQTASDCVHSGNCYAQGKAYLVSSGQDSHAYCSSGVWQDCDMDAGTCSACGFSWNNSACCGDDSDEFYSSRICLAGCETNLTDRSCCSIGTACVYNGICHETGEIMLLAGKNVSCEGGVWNLKSANASVCYKGECNKKNKCELPCPGCIFKDYSCYGTNCEADYRDPDSHWTFCGSCSLNWSLEDRSCCGDDEKEYWSPPCPKANASYRCCSNPAERVNSRGECVIFCGTTITADASVIEEGTIPLDIVAPDSVDIEAGKTSEFEIILRTGGGQALHNIMLSFCGPFGFGSSPYVIGELKPGEEKAFTVNVSAAADSMIGPSGIAVYVSSSELVGKRYRPVAVNVLVPEASSFDFYLAIAIVFAFGLALFAKRAVSRRHAKGKGPEQAGKEKTGVRSKKRESARGRLAEVVKQELDSGKAEQEIRDMLASNGFKDADIEAAFRQARKG